MVNMSDITITSSESRSLSKAELIAAIEKSFPGPSDSTVAVVTTTKARPEYANISVTSTIINQSITLAKLLEL